MNDGKNTRKLDREAADWLLKLERKDELSEEQLSEFLDWIKTSQAEQAYGRAEAVWKLSARLKDDPEITHYRMTLPQYLKRGKEKRNKGVFSAQFIQKSGNTKTFVKIASVCLLSIFLLKLTWFQSGDPSGDRQTDTAYQADTVYQTATGERKRIVLPDNTVVILNTATELHFSAHARQRRATLERGEALFEVAPSKNLPFKVHAGSGEIIALGTRFNVRLHENPSRRVEVALLEGKISVETGVSTAVSGAQGNIYKRVLSSNQAVSFDEHTPPKVSPIVEPEKVEAWKDGHLYFSAAPLSVIVAEVNRYTIDKLVIEDSRLKDEKISAYFDFDEGNYDSLLYALQENLGVKWYRRSGVTFLYRD